MATALALLMFFYYRRELRFHHRTPRWVLPGLRALAVFFVLLCLAGPVLRHEETFRHLGRVLILADASASMNFADETASASSASTRFDRLQQALLRPPSPLLSTLAQEHDVELFALHGSKTSRLWWHRSQGRDTSGDLPSRIAVPDATQTNLSQPLRDALGPSAANSAVILLSDGQHNTPGSPEDLALQLHKTGTPIFTVGYGLESPPPDLALHRITLPDAAFPGGRVEGILHVHDHLPGELPALATISAQGKTLWQLSFVSNGSGPRQIPFSFAADELPPSADPQQTLRLLDFRIALAQAASPSRANPDRISQNNQTSLALHLLNRKRKVLILDGRPRWETRYLHTHFDRDKRWQAVTAFDDFSDSPTNAVQKVFPQSATQLDTFDLIILGDLRPQTLRPEQHQMLRRFVEQRGGGLILLDGQRGHLQAWQATAADVLMPVSWRGQPAAPPLTHTLTAEGSALPALSLSDSPSTNQNLWEKLPPAQWCAAADPRPGAAIIGQFHSRDTTSVPSLIWRRVGAGSVLWMGTDEFWRWRYEVADLHHQRFWMQTASWIAAPPFLVEDERLSLGLDRLRYQENDRAELRIRLRDADGNILDLSDNTTSPLRAHLHHQGRQIATFQLEPDPAHGGVFRAQTSSLPSGDYTVSVSRNNTPVSDLQLDFRVGDQASEEWSQLTLNRPLLESISRNSGGRFLREGDIAQLPGLLRQLDRQETRIHETLLWSTWWWFGLILALLTLEWLLRKHWRLV